MILLVDTSEMNISHCVGCNCCWLKTPGICVIKDDYEQIFIGASGKRLTLLPAPPLRTVRDSFPSYGSSLS